MYRVRLMAFLSLGEDLTALAPRGTVPLEAVQQTLRDRIALAIGTRQSLGLPAESTTNAYRLVNSEGDNLSGMAVDIMAKYAVVQSSALWVEKHRQLISTTLREMVSGIEDVVWKRDENSLRKEGATEADSNGDEGNRKEGEDPLGGLEIDVLENSARFRVNVGMQKTGFYLDQRANRAFVRDMAKGKRVLDLCCYTGGFAVAAALGGAREVVGVDSSETAIEMAKQNASLNDVTSTVEFIVGDVTDFVRRSIKAQGSEEQGSFDMVILDPPKLCPSVKFLKRALGKYRQMNAMAMEMVKPGGMLITCSCSGAVTQRGLFIDDVLKPAAAKAGREVQVVQVGGASADHLTSLSYPEGKYLTVVTAILV